MNETSRVESVSQFYYACSGLLHYWRHWMLLFVVIIVVV